MTNILVQPQQLRQTAEQLRSHAQKIDQALHAIDNDIRSLKGHHFLGHRANSVQVHYAPKREALLSAKELVLRFSGELDDVASTFENADSANYAGSNADSKLPNESTQQRITEVNEETQDLRREYEENLKKMYNLLSQSTEKEKEALGSLVELYIAALEMYFAGEISFDAAIDGLDTISEGIMAALEAKGLEGEATGYMQRLSEIGDEISKNKYEVTYLSLLDKDAGFVMEERGYVQALFEQAQERRLDLEKSVEGLRNATINAVGELTGLQDSDELVKLYVQAMADEKSFNSELLAIDKRLAELGETP